MKKIGLYCANSKGYSVLKSFIDKFGIKSIAYVASYPNTEVCKDYFEEIKKIAVDNRIPFFQKNKSSINILEDYKIAIGWQWIISESENLIVLHDSILPKYRGFAPIVNALINGDTKVGVTALLASKNYDEGDIVYQESCPVSYPITIYEAIELATKIYISVIEKVYKMILMGKIITYKQNKDNITYSPWLDDLDYYIDWKWNAEKIKRFVDAVGFPYTGAKTHLNGSTISITNVRPLDREIKIENRERHIGKILFFREDKPVVICRQGLIIIDDIPLDKPNLRSRFY